MAEEDRHNPQEKAQFWKEHIDASKKTDLSQTEYCRQNNLKPSRFWYWKKRFKKTTEKKISFVPLSLPRHRMPQQLASIITPNGYRIELSDGFDPVVVGQLIHTIRDL